ncbi:MAG: hypothetical protein LC797_17200 [Chloroflexi bacterium]|nr:hypothetical protein [Chloroflexota bacterium]
MRFVGCTSYAHEEALLFVGDHIALRRGGARTDFADPRQARAGIFWRGVEGMLAVAARDADVPLVLAGASMVSIEKGAAAAPATTWY